uniref:Uncharacterized protein n=1 Tax=Rhizophora mucronata TaxID=61149 RepID=A0A2P2NYZ8_RHIMU
MQLFSKFILSNSVKWLSQQIEHFWCMGFVDFIAPVTCLP